MVHSSLLHTTTPHRLYFYSFLLHHVFDNDLSNFPRDPSSSGRKLNRKAFRSKEISFSGAPAEEFMTIGSRNRHLRCCLEATPQRVIYIQISYKMNYHRSYVLYFTIYILAFCENSKKHLRAIFENVRSEFYNTKKKWKKLRGRRKQSNPWILLELILKLKYFDL